ncbi:MAG TPA: quinone-dependent dihydroorotate dehydrogenase [Patescibacteria group bacterium]|nr:quinone-dependent dihydroorotate dehydrogenase [Patescibacteria group bacterium]
MKLKILGYLYQNLFRKILFLFDPEFIHDTITYLGKLIGSTKPGQQITENIFFYKSNKLGQDISGIHFANPIGLSAGFDKDANLVNIIPFVGFGFITVGTVTYQPYEGNPKPRLYRLKKSQALVVNYGLKNIGANKIVEKLKNYKKPEKFILGISVGKTNCPETSETKRGAEDYLNCLKVLNDNKIGDFYEINISCPNTFGGEPFTTPDKLELLLSRLTTLNISKPIFLKMPINLAWEEFKNLLDVTITYRINGVTIGNLNKNRKDPNIKDEIPEYIKGNISGKPTYKLSNDLIRETYKYSGDKLKIIGVGGVFSPEDAYEKIKLGASLVGLITGMIYQGPQLIGQINDGLEKELNKNNLANLAQAIGSELHFKA